MPRTTGVSSRITDCRSLRSPRERTVSFCVCWLPMGLRRRVILSLSDMQGRLLQLLHPGVSSSTVLERSWATSPARLSCRRAFRVAQAMLMALAEPSDLPSTSRTPASSRMARTLLPATMPVPGEAGLSITSAAPSCARISCGIVPPTIGTSIRFFLAASPPLRIASGMARALPSPTPTWPLPSPTTTRALQLMVRPPWVVFWHLLVRTTRSSRLSVSGLILANGHSFRAGSEFQSLSCRAWKIPVCRAATPPTVLRTEQPAWRQVVAFVEREEPAAARRPLVARQRREYRQAEIARQSREPLSGVPGSRACPVPTLAVVAPRPLQSPGRRPPRRVIYGPAGLHGRISPVEYSDLKD